ncbi:MAG: nucleotide exchange factor GrpE [Clostridia bacterium]
MNKKETNKEPNKEPKVKKEVTKDEEKVKTKIIDKAPSTEELLANEKDKYLRLLAEFDNFKKRTVKEKTAIYDDSVIEVIQKIMPVYDNLQRAVEVQGEDFAKLKEGLLMVIKQLEETLKAIGVEEITTDGFDPLVHNAVIHIEDEKLSDNEIVEVLQKGYKLKDKVIRHSMVKVAN